MVPTIATITLALLSLLSLLISSSLADLVGWPELDKPPPPTSEFNNLVDLSKVANAPLAIVDSNGNIQNCGAEGDFCSWSCTNCVGPNDVDKCPNKGDWGLSFDDGPSDFTGDLVDFLNSQGIKATFFIVGSRVVERPDILQKIVNSGHQIGIHTWSHPMLTTLTNEQVIAELQWTAKVINATVGLIPQYMRPPYGDVDDRIRDICLQLGYTVTLWDRDTNDWMVGGGGGYNVHWVTGNFTKWVKEDSNTITGHISLEHDIYQKSAGQGPKVVPILQNANFNIKSVANCLGDENPYLNSNSTIALTPTKTTTSSGTINPSEAIDISGNGRTSDLPDSNPKNLGSPTPMSSSESINYNNWLIILGLVMSLSTIFHN